MKITTVKGTNDYLPAEARLRDYLQSKIIDVYTRAGFEHIITPAIESAENLDKSDGGDNLNLIFKILKRGDKLEKALQNGDELCDMGLRYDLTLPLSRYYANNRSHMLAPAKFIQTGSVYRAERPQKGRLREFVQCDIDIIGSKSINCEIELIHTTAKALLAIGIRDFTVRINDRRILKALLLNVGFEESKLDSVCITFDKLDKIGADGVAEELLNKGFDEKVVVRFKNIIEKPMSIENIGEICGEAIIADVKKIINAVCMFAEGYDIKFDMSLVRGQGYYTGTVFEVVSDKFKGSIAGGGRYDNLIGKFLNEDIPAVGFSIGFERIFSILSAENYSIPDAKKKIAIFYDSDEIADVIHDAESLRDKYETAIYERPKKLSKYLDRLKEAGYYGFCFCGKTDELKVLE